MVRSSLAFAGQLRAVAADKSEDSVTSINASPVEDGRPFDRPGDLAAAHIPIGIAERHVERSARCRTLERPGLEVDRVSGFVGVEHDEQVDVAVAVVIAAGDGAIEPDCGWIELGHEVGDDDVGPFVESSAVPNERRRPQAREPLTTATRARRAGG